MKRGNDSNERCSCSVTFSSITLFTPKGQNRDITLSIHNFFVLFNFLQEGFKFCPESENWVAQLF
jgi:hypothetical protein